LEGVLKPGTDGDGIYQPRQNLDDSSVRNNDSIARKLVKEVLGPLQQEFD